MLNTEIASVLEYRPGMELHIPPPLSAVPEEQLAPTYTI
jgi:hypothetical protein